MDNAELFFYIFKFGHVVSEYMLIISITNHQNIISIYSEKGHKEFAKKVRIKGLANVLISRIICYKCNYFITV